ncbi:MAG: anti-sigma factor [Chitinophagaceae bacterium]
MDIRLYIESGAIESYVLGLSNASEAAEIELLMTEHAEIKKAVDDFASEIEQFALQNTIPQPEEIKGKLIHEISSYSADKKFTPVIPFASKKNISAPLKLWQYVAAASIILFIASAALNFYLYNNYQSTNNKYQALLTQQNSLQANNDIYKTKMDSLIEQQNNLQAKNDLYKNKLNDLSESMKIIANPAMKIVKMKGVPGKENNLATVYWNAETKDVYLLQNNLPQTPPDKQYQLWAIVDGKPVDAGMIGDCNGKLCKMKNMPQAQAFAITLEKKGGNPTPTMSAMYVMGKV